MEEEINLDRAAGDGSDVNSPALSSSSSFSSAFSSSNVDTESTSSFFQERSITLGSLIGLAGDAALADGDHVPFHWPGDAATPLHTLAQSTTSSQGLSFAHTARVGSGTKLCSLLPCVTCKGPFYSNRGTFRVFCCADKADRHVGPPANELLSSSLGRLLVAERNAERSLERDDNGPSDGARVYINIMYEENAGLEQATINPLFDAHSTSTREMGGSTHSNPRLQGCTRSQNLSGELCLSLSRRTEDEPHVMLVERMSRADLMPRHGSTAPCNPPSLHTKGQKGLSSRVFPLGCVSLGCVSYMWTRCKF